MIRRKIQGLKAKLKGVERHRDNLRAGREAMLNVALVGYTNAGKSSILRALTGEHEILVEDRLFATLDTLTREVTLGDGERARVSDTVGFIRKLPHHLVASFRATLEETRDADVLLHVVDASHPDWEGQMRVVEGVLEELGVAERPLLPVFNKIDAVADAVGFGRRVAELYPDAVLATTMRTDGLTQLKTKLRELASAGRVTVRVQVPLADGASLAALYRAGEVVSRAQTAGAHDLMVRLEPWRGEELRRSGLVIDPATTTPAPEAASGSYRRISGASS